ncbi:hypothetical protein [Amycolatopsis vancoresmycina]|uniref:Uncharacterized protein n=1 Tax=Amycolatopsis vancoresmycina DSM 44592 TaxID=1292037 RepID=R1I5M8_9PSEU|nr:hypothetical protein [Amycolatopsis vancoresmycina]EOD67831.1 hypothetical protein H480_14492 [Amycolatopsis vancoresmycina DSM 44592]
MEVPSERNGILILRVWLESGRPDNFRARVFRSIGPDQAPPLVFSEVDDVRSAVQDWLDELLGPGGDGPATPW